MAYNVQMKIVKRSICAHKMWKHSVNLLFTEKVWKDQNIVRSIIFRGWTAADHVGKPSSSLPQDLVMRWSWSRVCTLLSHSYLMSTHVSDRVLLTITSLRHMDEILGKVSLSPYSPKITAAYRELHVYFAVQIPPFVDWTWTAEMTLSLQVDLMLSNAAATSEP